MISISRLFYSNAAYENASCFARFQSLPSSPTKKSQPKFFEGSLNRSFLSNPFKVLRSSGSSLKSPSRLLFIRVGVLLFGSTE